MRLEISNYSRYRFENEWQFDLLTEKQFRVVYEDFNKISIFKR